MKKQGMDSMKLNALAKLAEELEAVHEICTRGCTNETTVGKVVRKAQLIVAELAKVIHGEASPTPWRKHTDREVRADDDRLWLENVVCQTQSCPKTRYTKAERKEWDMPATANTELIVASVNAVAKCRAIAEK